MEIPSVGDADQFGAAGGNVALGIDGHDLKSHIVGLVQCGDGFHTERIGKVLAEQFRFLAAKKKKRRRFSISGIFTYQPGNCGGVPYAMELVDGRAGRPRRAVRSGGPVRGCAMVGERVHNKVRVCTCVFSVGGCQVA